MATNIQTKVTIRSAAAEDIPAVAELIKPYVWTRAACSNAPSTSSRSLLPNFFVAVEEDGTIIVRGARNLLAQASGNSQPGRRVVSAGAGHRAQLVDACVERAA